MNCNFSWTLKLVVQNLLHYWSVNLQLLQMLPMHCMNVFPCHWLFFCLQVKVHESEDGIAEHESFHDSLLNVEKWLMIMKQKLESFHSSSGGWSIEGRKHEAEVCVCVLASLCSSSFFGGQSLNQEQRVIIRINDEPWHWQGSSFIPIIIIIYYVFVALVYHQEEAVTLYVVMMICQVWKTGTTRMPGDIFIWEEKNLFYNKGYSLLTNSRIQNLNLWVLASQL